jgi:hypothetical protein
MQEIMKVVAWSLAVGVGIYIILSQVIAGFILVSKSVGKDSVKMKRG